MAGSKANITEGFHRFLRQIRQTVRYRAWLSHPEYSQDSLPPDKESLAEANTEIGEIFRSVISPEDGGTLGDMTILAMQGDLIAAARRAITSREMTPIDCRLASVSRLTGHAADTGVWGHGIPSYIQSIDKISKRA